MMRLLVCLSALAISPGLWAQQQWPDLPLPDQGRPFAVASQSVLDGVPTRIQGWESSQTVQQQRDWVVAHWPTRSHVQEFPGKTIVSSLQGVFLYNALIEPSSTGGSITLFSVARLPNSEEKSAFEAKRSRWLSLFPVDTRMVSHHVSREGDKHITVAVFSNRFSVRMNALRLQAYYRQHGFHQTDTQAQLEQGSASTGDAEQTMHWARGANTEVLALLGRKDRHTLTTVVQTVQLEHQP